MVVHNSMIRNLMISCSLVALLGGAAAFAVPPKEEPQGIPAKPKGGARGSESAADEANAQRLSQAVQKLALKPNATVAEAGKPLRALLQKENYSPAAVKAVMDGFLGKSRLHSLKLEVLDAASKTNRTLTVDEARMGLEAAQGMGAYLQTTNNPALVEANNRKIQSFQDIIDDADPAKRAQKAEAAKIEELTQAVQKLALKPNATVAEAGPKLRSFLQSNGYSPAAVKAVMDGFLGASRLFSLKVSLLEKAQETRPLNPLEARLGMEAAQALLKGANTPENKDRVNKFQAAAGGKPLAAAPSAAPAKPAATPPVDPFLAAIQAKAGAKRPAATVAAIEEKRAALEKVVLLDQAALAARKIGSLLNVKTQKERVDNLRGYLIKTYVSGKNETAENAEAVNRAADIYGTLLPSLQKTYLEIMDLAFDAAAKANIPLPMPIDVAEALKKQVNALPAGQEKRDLEAMIARIRINPESYHDAEEAREAIGAFLWEIYPEKNMALRGTQVGQIMAVFDRIHDSPANVLRSFRERYFMDVVYGFLLVQKKPIVDLDILVDAARRRYETFRDATVGGDDFVTGFSDEEKRNGVAAYEYMMGDIHNTKSALEQEARLAPIMDHSRPFKDRMALAQKAGDDHRIEALLALVMDLENNPKDVAQGKNKFQVNVDNRLQALDALPMNSNERRQGLAHLIEHDVYKAPAQAVTDEVKNNIWRLFPQNSKMSAREQVEFLRIILRSQDPVAMMNAVASTAVSYPFVEKNPVMLALLKADTLPAIERDMAVISLRDFLENTPIDQIKALKAGFEEVFNPAQQVTEQQINEAIAGLKSSQSFKKLEEDQRIVNERGLIINTLLGVGKTKVMTYDEEIQNVGDYFLNMIPTNALGLYDVDQKENAMYRLQEVYMSLPPEQKVVFLSLVPLALKDMELRKTPFLYPSQLAADMGNTLEAEKNTTLGRHLQGIHDHILFSMASYATPLEAKERMNDAIFSRLTQLQDSGPGALNSTQRVMDVFDRLETDSARNLLMSAVRGAVFGRQDKLQNLEPLVIEITRLATADVDPIEDFRGAERRHAAQMVLHALLEVQQQ